VSSSGFPSHGPCEQRPWGWFETLAVGDGYLVKRLCILAGRRISLQRHRWRSEHWLVVGGDGLLECQGQRLPAGPGTSLNIPVGAVHRASAGRADLLIVEVQQGDRLREDDIERLADDFGRQPLAGGGPEDERKYCC
jgi:mannose-6-phosphate isomerase